MRAIEPPERLRLSQRSQGGASADIRDALRDALGRVRRHMDDLLEARIHQDQRRARRAGDLRGRPPGQRCRGAHLEGAGTRDCTHAGSFLAVGDGGDRRFRGRHVRPARL